MGEFIVKNGILKTYEGAGGDVVIPEGVTSIGSEAFRGCSGLTSVTIPKSVTSIGKRAFYSCPKLTIYAAAGSVAEQFAKKNSISFEAI